MKHIATDVAERDTDAGDRFETAYILSSECSIEIPCHYCQGLMRVALKALVNTSLLERVVLCDQCGEPQCLSKEISQWLVHRLKQSGYYYQPSAKGDQSFNLEPQLRPPSDVTNKGNLLSFSLPLEVDLQHDSLHQIPCQDKPNKKLT